MTVWTFNSIWTSTILHILWNINGLLNKGKWVMTMFREALIWIVLLIFNLINTFLVFVGKTSLFKVPLWSTWLVWGIVTIIIIGVLLFRKHLQKSSHLLIKVSIIKILKRENSLYKCLYISLRIKAM